MSHSLYLEAAGDRRMRSSRAEAISFPAMAL
jgi:hypothetical protein